MKLMNALPNILGTRARLLRQPSIVKVLLEGKVQCVSVYCKRRGKGGELGENGTCDSPATDNKKIIKERFEEERKQTHPTENGK